MSHEYRASLQYTRECQEILKERKRMIESIVAACKETEERSSSVIDSDMKKMMDKLYRDCDDMVKSIDKMSSELNSPVFQDMISIVSSKVSSVNNLYLQIQAINSSVVNAALSEDTSPKAIVKDLESVEDPKLRSMMKLLAKNKEHQSLSFDELKTLAQSKLDPSMKVSGSIRSSAESDIKKALKVDDETLKTMSDDPSDSCSPLELMDKVSDQIMDETLRKSAVTAIVKSIRDKGFVVEKKNIRKVGDVVTIVALKPGNQRAQFTIDLDGKFTYRFDGYQGSACEKDISSMEEDLEKIYGIKVTEKKSIWSNPDKLTKRAVMDQRAGRV